MVGNTAGDEEGPAAGWRSPSDENQNMEGGGWLRSGPDLIQLEALIWHLKQFCNWEISYTAYYNKQMALFKILCIFIGTFYEEFTFYIF